MFPLSPPLPTPLRITLLLFLGVAACDASSDPRSGMAYDAGSGSDTAEAGPVLPRCRPPAGFTGSPRTIAEALALVNALPPPVTLACFLQSLDRPLYAFATYSVISLQPAVGSRSPRIFLFDGKAGGLVMSIVPEGMGSPALEFGQFVDDTRTIKGEIAFPVNAPLLPSAPYDKILSGRGMIGTSCRFCHPDEQRAPDIDYAEAFISGAFRPNWRTKVEITSLLSEHRRCDPAAEPGRCAILSALFDHGEVVQRELPEIVPTIN
jgi:hypothetical protein